VGGEQVRLLLPVPVDNLVPGDGEKPRCQAIDLSRDAVTRYELDKNILQDIFRVFVGSDTPPDEVEKPPALVPDRRFDSAGIVPYVDG